MRTGEEIAPYTIEEALRLPRYFALAKIQAGGSPVAPFIVKAAPPAPKAKARDTCGRNARKGTGGPPRGWQMRLWSGSGIFGRWWGKRSYWQHRGARVVAVKAR